MAENTLQIGGFHWSLKLCSRGVTMCQSQFTRLKIDIKTPVLAAQNRKIPIWYVINCLINCDIKRPK